MSHRLRIWGGVAAVLAGSSSALASTPWGASATETAPHGNRAIRVCATPAQGFAACHALRLEGVAVGGRPHPSPTPTATPSAGTGACAGEPQPATGYGPCDLRSAYNLATASATLGSGTTVAIVDAYDDPKASSDLCTYRATYGLPKLVQCGASTGPTFTKVNQYGGTKYPRANGGWAQEISLDLDMVSAICPNCNILLVEASSNSLSNLLTAEDYASAHATYVSNSWGGSEFSGETAYDGHFNRSGHVVTVSSGDTGYGTEWPASSPYVVAVGGTTLLPAATTRGWSETAWSGAGSGCSAYEPQPSWQASVRNITAACSRRAVADVAADADPNTGVNVYDTYSYQGLSGWLVFGGTSVGAPIIASVYALTGTTPTAGASVYANASSLYDVTSGSNGSCGGTPLCTATVGWDGPTGNGTPNSTTAF